MCNSCWLSGNKEEHNKTFGWINVWPFRLKNHCPEDEVSTIKTFRAALFRQLKGAQQLFNSSQLYENSGLVFTFVLEANVRHIRHLCTRQPDLTAPFLSNMLGWTWQLAAWGWSFRGCRHTEGCTEPELYETSSSILAQVLCSHAVGTASGRSSLCPAKVCPYSYAERQPGWPVWFPGSVLFFFQGLHLTALPAHCFSLPFSWSLVEWSKHWAEH